MTRKMLRKQRKKKRKGSVWDQSVLLHSRGRRRRRRRRKRRGRERGRREGWDVGG